MDFILRENKLLRYTNIHCWQIMLSSYYVVFWKKGNNKRIQQEIEVLVLYLKIATLVRVEKKNETNLNSCIRANSPQKRIYQHALIW